MNSIVKHSNQFGLLDPLFDGFFTGESTNKIMRTDIKEYEDYYEFKVDVPEVKKENIHLSLEDGYLTIEASILSESDEKNKYIRRERFYGSYKRNFFIGEDIVEEDIKAKLVDGVLTLTINKVKPKEKETKYIEIE